ncbi:MAG: conjugative relaxase [Gammaproteobacteria bacterium]|nr:conjugative relaxase [Gammaproteobacteria bacterium]
MLTISVGDSEAWSYLSKDNYYSNEEGVECSLWRGVGAEYLDLSGKVDPTIFRKLLSGEVDGERLGRLVKGEVKHSSGYDLTFSAPKTVSILSEVFGLSDVREAHEKAVSDALAAAEKLIDTRLTVNGKTTVTPTNNAVFATFTHDVNRNLDCQVHTHSYLLNMTKTDRGWRSLHMVRLFDSQRKKRLGKVYRAALAVYLKEAGYTLTAHRDPTLFEIGGVPKGLIDEFSTRSKEIEEWFETNTIPYDPVMAKTVALMSRKAKKAVDRDALLALWKERAAAYEFDPGVLKVNKADRENEKRGERDQKTSKNREDSQEANGVSVKSVVRRAIAHLLEQDMGFTGEVLEKEALSFGLGFVRFDEIGQEIQRLIQIGALQESKEHTDLDRRESILWTTPEMKAVEASLIQLVSEGKGRGKELVKGDYVEKMLAKSILNEQQRKAIVGALTSTDRFYAIQGDPGVGKTTALREYKKILFKKGYEVLAMAPTYQALTALTESLEIKGMTVARYLADPNSKNLGRPLRKQVWVLDEAGMEGIDSLTDLMALAEERKARILFVGDHQQLESVGRGRGFKQLLEGGIGVSILNQSVRPQTEIAKESFKLVMDKQYGQAVRLLSGAGNVVELEVEEEAINRLSSQWLSLSEKQRRRTVIIAPTNEQCGQINEVVREGLKKKGDIDQKDIHYTVFNDKHMTGEQIKSASLYEKGDVLRFSQEHLDVGKKRGGRILRGEYFEVYGVNVTTNRLALKPKKGGPLLYVDPTLVGGNTKGGIQVFTQRSMGVAKGDQIRWLDNSNDLGLKRNTELRVTRLSEKWVRFEDNKGKSFKIELKDLKQTHFTHDYAKTAYGVQGSTKKEVIALMNSWRINSTNARSFMVAATRITHKMTLYTDSASKLIGALSGRSGDNTEALTTKEFSKSVRIAAPVIESERKPARALI